MRGYAVYLATRMKHQARPRRCCSDEPTSYADTTRPGALARWSIKLTRAVPGSLRVARAAFRDPASIPVPTVGAIVVRLDGSRLGRVNEVLVSLGSGETSLSIQPTEGPEGRVILLPSSILRPSGKPDVFVAPEIGRSSHAA
jgi:hypothetical protein